MQSKVFWLITALDRMEESLGKSALQNGACEARLNESNEKLLATFLEADAIIVEDVLQGYRSRVDEQILRVEVITDQRPLSHIIKIGPPDKLKRELEGWQECQRRGNARGRIFMGLHPGKPSSVGDRFYDTLVYEDAHQVLRAAEVISLEKAVRNCCQWGRPPADSILDVLGDIFAEMSDRFYRRSWPEPATAEVCDYWRERVRLGNEAWNTPNTPAARCRREARAALPAHVGELLDPCELLEEILHDPEIVPELQRGCAHGDLHGRNILVGLVEGRARWPAVFDYEEMGRANYLGWDFVKMETELKVRMLPEILAGREDGFIQAVYEFEERLAHETEQRNDLVEWVRDSEDHTPEGRLFSLLLGIRRLARACLETQRSRGRRWLEEYYFLLICYGVYAGRFDNYQRRELTATYIASGIAANRYAWRRCDWEDQIRAAVQQARDALQRDDCSQSAGPSDFHTAGHHAKLAFAREWVRSRQADFVKAAICILHELQGRYPHVVDVGQELALAYAEMASLDPIRRQEHWNAAQRVLAGIGYQYHYEGLCRFGRLWKDRGDEALAHGDSGQAQSCYENSLKYYQRAYGIDKHYYPGINMATMSLLLGNDAESRSLAQSILSDLENDQRDWGDNLVWILATRAEAHLLLGQCREAASLYQQAVAQPNCHPHDVDAMGKQSERILKARPCRDGGDEILDVFGHGQMGSPPGSP